MDKVFAIDSLQEIVKEFNQKFSEWTETHDARVTFGWQYGNGHEKQVKALEVIGVDQIIYRKPPPKGLGELMGAGGSSKPAETGEVQPSK